MFIFKNVTFSLRKCRVTPVVLDTKQHSCSRLNDIIEELLWLDWFSHLTVAIATAAAQREVLCLICCLLFLGQTIQ